jgi:hypothetical protein
MTFALTILLGVGILLVVSAFEDVSISQTLRDILNGKLSRPATPAKEPTSGPTEATSGVSEAPVGVQKAG